MQEEGLPVQEEGFLPTGEDLLLVHFFSYALALAWKEWGGGSAGPCKWIFTCMRGAEGGPPPCE